MFPHILLTFGPQMSSHVDRYDTCTVKPSPTIATLILREGQDKSSGLTRAVVKGTTHLLNSFPQTRRYRTRQCSWNGLSTFLQTQLFQSFRGLQTKMQRSSEGASTRKSTSSNNVNALCIQHNLCVQINHKKILHRITQRDSNLT